MFSKMPSPTNGLLLVLLGLLAFICCCPHAVAAEEVDDGHQGLYSHRISGGQLVIPRKVSHFGGHISHDLTHHWPDDGDEKEDDDNNNNNEPVGLLGLANKKAAARRRKRTAAIEPKLHYHLELNNETLHIELEPSHDSFIAPLMVVERHRRDTRSRRTYHQQKKKLNGTACHYQGKIRDHPNSKVALSACNGLAGYMATKDGFYWVEPSKKHRYHPELGHPHVIFQGQNEIPSASATKLPKKLQKHRRQQQQQHQRRKRTSTCGTKEPKQAAETRIEWQKQGKVIVQGGRKARYRQQQQQEKQSQWEAMRRKKHRREEQRRRRRRPKRSVSTAHHVEVLLVADHSMSQFHEDVEMYLKTIMNMVSSLYKDPTIGNRVQLSVVKIIILDEEAEEYDDQPEVTHQAESTLSDFCRWQRTVNPESDDHAEHHDVAILITRKDICTGNGCMTLGVANVGGMCRPDRSCSVNEDNGITLAHTITHELGHNFGMYHDTEKTGCGHRIGPILHVMTPSFESDTTHVSWSKCSRRDITHFLDQGLGSCLDDEPTANESTGVELLPPGAMYKANQQCRFQFNTTDETVKVCSRVDEICSQLWCEIDNHCVTQLKAAAPGTNCGHHKWCQEQKCVPMYDSPPKAVDGGWGNWTQWSECSRSCGSGISIQSRVCDNPLPAHGGSFCIGKRTMYKTCNTDPCPVGEPSFRATQCTRYNNETFRGKTYTWLPYFDTHEPCKLFCTDTDDEVIVPWGNSDDGTPCNIGTNDMCINGICKQVGCDWIVGSATKEDQCGVCGGEGDSCQVVNGTFSEKVNITEGYYPIVTIPMGSRNIHVEELSKGAKNYLSIGKANSKTFFLNGGRSIYISGEYNIAGAIGLYERKNENRETLKVPGPIEEDIILYVLMRGTKEKNVRLRYEYTLSSNSTVQPVYNWKLGDWTACSTTCGGGVQHRFPICYQDFKGIVDMDLCFENAPNVMPTQLNQACNELQCPYKWFEGKWQMCAQTCKKRPDDPEPIKKRTVFCIDHLGHPVGEENCADLEPLETTAPCADKLLPICESDEEQDVDKNKL